MMGSSDGDGYGDPFKQPQFYQNVVVMRHGDRLDNVVLSGRRRRRAPGTLRWRRTARSGHSGPAKNSTAAEVIAALCAVANNSDDPNDLTSNGVVIDPSKIKVSIEYGLSEMMNSLAIRDPVAPKDGIFSFNISECESVLPAGTIDNTVEMVYKKLPQWQETVEGARARYLEVIKTLADKYPSENLLLVTHGKLFGGRLLNSVLLA
ncbi:hypothetical protein DH2020_023336 [Rehmannia glutinosa]|uniref:Phosphoglycerate mutase-like protein n=1 Tax=Rehmannia glutinosa TaxID=99300 RepID=A0ABR0W5R3_REHGL